MKDDFIMLLLLFPMLENVHDIFKLKDICIYKCNGVPFFLQFIQ